MSSENQAILDVVRQFLRLNDSRRQHPLQSNEVQEWYRLKYEIEKNLFSNPPLGIDKRQSIRIKNLKIPVHYESGTERCEAQVREISEGGLFIATTDPASIGTELELSLDIMDTQGLPDHEIIFPARVIYTNTGSSLGDRAFSGMGMMIMENIHPDEQRKWFHLVDRLLENLVTSAA